MLAAGGLRWVPASAPERRFRGVLDLALLAGDGPKMERSAYDRLVQPAYRRMAARTLGVSPEAPRVWAAMTRLTTLRQ
jgi:hypothetical protein